MSEIYFGFDLAWASSISSSLKPEFNYLSKLSLREAPFTTVTKLFANTSTEPHTGRQSTKTVMMQTFERTTKVED